MAMRVFGSTSTFPSAGDENTIRAVVMKNVYEATAKHNELEAVNKSQALREASLRLLKDRRYRHPFYWAGFVLVSIN